MKPAVRVLVTGAAGQIAYSLIHSICKGDVFGKGQSLILHLLDIPQMMGVLEGVVMEINDCAFDTVQDVVATCSEEEAFKGIDAAFLVGAMPRREGMERKDLLSANVKIFKSQGKALDTFANKDCKILVVGNPANTNALICSHYAPSIPKENFSAMTRLDHNRALAQLADKLKVSATDIHDVVIWGNHSLTQFPDASNARFTREGTQLQVTNELPPEYLLDEFVTVVQKRGGAVIAARKLSSAMSAAKAAVDHMHDWWHGTGDHLVSMAVYSDNSPYPNVPGGLFFSFPVTIDGNRKWHIKDGLTWNETAQKKIDVSIKELQEEKQEAMVVCSD